MTAIDARTAAADPMWPVRYRVVDNRRETQDSVSLTLAPFEGSIPHPVPGQFAMLWAPGIGEVPISFSRIPGDGTLVHTIRDVGGVTGALCRSRPGHVVGVRGPYGVGWPMAAARGHDVVIVAGGVGSAPVRPVIDAVLADPAAHGRLTVIIGAHTYHDLLFRDELHHWWRDRVFELRTTVDESCSHWRAGSVGLVTSELHRVDIDGPATVAMVCGPEVMMRIVSRALVDRGVAPRSCWVSVERNMQCGVGLCGHCQLAGRFVCRDGPVFDWGTARPLLGVAEL